jgi:L-lactate dehydrogenase complex protein LldE
VPSVALFVTCVVDSVTPDVGVDAVRLLEAAGCTVEFPAAQTCCGQPALNTGEPEAAARLARHFVDVFEPFDAVVAPSGSCAAMPHHWYARILSGADAERGAAVAAKTYELSQYLVDVLGIEDLGARIDATVTIHDSCHLLRMLGVREPVRRLLHAAGATVVEMADAEVCCGFGGTFSIKHDEIAAPMADDKLGNAAATGAAYLVAGDSGCLLHLTGRQRRVGTPGPAPIHFASLLAGGLP